MRVLRAPALWPFATLAAKLGWDAALAACDERESTPEIEAVLSPALYRVTDLPLGDDVRGMVVGVRVKLAGDSKTPLQTTARSLGYTLREAQRGLRALRSFCRPGIVTPQNAHRI